MLLSVWTGVISAAFWLASAAISARAGPLSLREIFGAMLFVDDVTTEDLRGFLRNQFFVTCANAVAAIFAAATVIAQALHH